MHGEEMPSNYLPVSWKIITLAVVALGLFEIETTIKSVIIFQFPYFGPSSSSSSNLSQKG
jgi:hypothetical protein